MVSFAASLDLLSRPVTETTEIDMNSQITVNAHADMNIIEDIAQTKVNQKPEITASSTHHNHPSTELLFENP